LTSHLDSKDVQYRILHDMTELVPDVYKGFSIKLVDEGDLQHLENSVHVEVRLLSSLIDLNQSSDIFYILAVAS
jgi:hypothetical protein